MKKIIATTKKRVGMIESMYEWLESKPQKSHKSKIHVPQEGVEDRLQVLDFNMHDVRQAACRFKLSSSQHNIVSRIEHLESQITTGRGDNGGNRGSSSNKEPPPR